MVTTVVFLGVAMGQMMQSPEYEPVNRPPPLPGRNPCMSEPLPVHEEPNPKYGPEGFPQKVDTTPGVVPKAFDDGTGPYHEKGSGFHCGAFHS